METTTNPQKLQPKRLKRLSEDSLKNQINTQKIQKDAIRKQEFDDLIHTLKITTIKFSYTAAIILLIIFLCLELIINSYETIYGHLINAALWLFSIALSVVITYLLTNKMIDSKKSFY
jgi:hypothetical protein